MKIVILAAGKGSRLENATLPKPLTPLANGKSILAQQLYNLSLYFSLHQVVVVIGYRKEMIMEQFPDLEYVYNPLFAEENTAKSLLRALKKIEEDVLWLNGDVVFHPATLAALANRECSCMVVNEGRVGEEEVKYKIDPSGAISEVSKTVEGAQGEALGINFFKIQDLNLLRQELEKCLPSDYFEKAIECCIQKGLRVEAAVVGADQCTEIDFPEDLARANQLIKKWK